MKKALLIVAHGSRREASNEEVVLLTKRVSHTMKTNHYIDVQSAFLELANPSIAEGVDNLAARGVDRIDVLPYFLSAGRHVSEDIPAIISEVSLKYPDIEITLKNYIGGSPKMVDYIHTLLNERS